MHDAKTEQALVKSAYKLFVLISFSSNDHLRSIKRTKFLKYNDELS